MRKLFRSEKDKGDKQPPVTPNRKRKRGADTAAAKKTEVPKKGRKVLGAIFRFLVVAVFSLGLIWTVCAAYRHVTTNEYFAVKEFGVVGQDRLSAEEILKTAGVEKGENIFHIDIGSMRKNLIDHPWILDAKIERRLPRTIKIDVTERRVEAMALFDVPYLVDDTGEVFKRWARGDPTKGPIISGFTREQFLSDTEAVRETIRDAIDLARRYKALSISKTEPLSEIHCEVNGDFSLTLEGDGTYVRFGSGPYRVKLKRLAALLGRLRREGRRTEMIFFDNEIRPDRATVRLKKTSTEENEVELENRAWDDAKKRMSKI